MGNIDYRASNHYRVIHGVKIRIHGTKAKDFLNEALRWVTIRDGLDECRRAIPLTERGMFATLSEAMAYAEFRRRREVVKLDPGCKQSDLF